MNGCSAGTLAVGLTGNRKRVAWTACLAIALLCVWSTSQALNPERMISQYGHTAWRLRDGDLPSPPYPVAQTLDGYVWIGTQSGLLRFDGVRFVPLAQLTATPLPSKFVTALHGARDGSLWIATTQGLSHWHKNKLLDVSGVSVANALLEDENGTIWFTTQTAHDGTRDPSLCKVEANAATCFARKEGIVFSNGEANTGSLYQDRDGMFWFATDWSIARWKPGTQATVTPDPAKIKAATPGRLVFAETSDARWIGVDARGPGLGLQRLQGDTIATVDSPLNGSQLAVQALFVDHSDALWVGTLDDGIYRIRGRQVDHFRTTDGLSSDCIYWFFEDAGHNLWVTTSEGVDRFRDLPVSTFSKREGRSVDEADSVLVTRDGRVWVGGGEALDILDHGVFAAYKTNAGLPGNQVTSMLEDHAGQVWIGIDNRLTLFEGGKFVPVDSAEGKPLGLISSLAEDAQGNVWARYAKTLGRIRERKVQEEFPIGAARLAADRSTGVWAVSADGALAHFHDGTVDRFTLSNRPKRVSQAITAADGSLWIATDIGLIGWKEGTERHLGLANGLPCEYSTELEFGAAGDLWLFAECGLLRIPASDLERWWSDGNTAVAPHVFDQLDGVRSGRPSFRALSRAPDGKLWLGNGVNLQVLDPAQAQRGTSPPIQVLIENTTSDRRNFGGGLDIALPPNPGEIQIDYTATGPSVPQRTRFRYRLDGHDEDWREAGQRRQAFYNDLGPAAYRFRVAASDDGTIWHEAAMPLALRVVPAWYQTSWARILGALACAAIVAALYRMRLRQVGNALKARFDERLAERTRLARDLHDTLLQTIQSSKMVADDALEHAQDTERLARTMYRLSEWLGAAVREGREALHALRATTTQTNDLAESLRRAGTECAANGGMEFHFQVTGTHHELHPIVRDEIYRIGYEAIRNACAHSKGSRLDVSLGYLANLQIVVRDDGIGLDPDGRSPISGHFGIQGMRERAARIGAQLHIGRAMPAGTEVRLIVPVSVAYRESEARPRGIRGRWRRLAAIARTGKPESG